MTAIEHDPRTHTTEVVAHTDDLAEGEMKLARVGERRIAVIRTASGIHALDNACPHQGYGLVTGSLDGELLTCQWHNWKFRASDGTCVLGEEDVPCHEVHVSDSGDIAVTVVEPNPEEARAALWPSLARGFDKDYTGQMARDTARLLRAGASPEEVVALGVDRSQPREEYGVGHGLAMAADCLAMIDLYDGDERTLPVVQALSSLSEPTRHRSSWELPDGDASVDLAHAIETEDLDGALSATVGRLDDDDTPASLRAAFIEAASQHHIGYGHGAIYVQKSFEMLERIGWDHARSILPFLTMTLTFGTREDALPYMRKAMRLIGAADLGAMATAPDRSDTGWADDGSVRTALLDSPEAAIDEAVAAVLAGAGVEGLLDTVTLAVAERLLRYDPAIDFTNDQDFGWLDITHGLTYANAARWAWRHHPGPDTARLALFTVFLAHDTGRAERWGWQDPTTPPLEPRAGDVMAAVLDGRADDAVAHALAGDPAEVGEALARASLADRATSWIVVAHVVKLAQAAREEAAATGSSLPLAAAARFAAAPRLERFVARNVAEAVDFVRTGTPPKR